VAERSQNRFAREKLQQERIVYFSDSGIVKNGSRQFNGGFDFGNCEYLDALVRSNP
jgi:hypothetical protein